MYWFVVYSGWPSIHFSRMRRVPVYSLGVRGLDPCSRRLRRLVAVSARCRRGVVAVSARCPLGVVVNSCRGDWRRACPCVALCRGDCWWARRLGCAVSLGLLTRSSSGWRRVMGIADQGVSGLRCVIRIPEHGVVWVGPCHRNC